MVHGLSLATITVRRLGVSSGKGSASLRDRSWVCHAPQPPLLKTPDQTLQQSADCSHYLAAVSTVDEDQGNLVLYGLGGDRTRSRCVW